MKNLLKATLFLAIPLLITSCGKDDTGEPDNGDKAAIIKIEVTNDNFSNYEETINIQVVGDKMKSTQVTGADWDEVEEPHATTKWFMKQQAVKPSVIYQTTDKVVSLTYVALINSKEEGELPLNTEIKIYADGKLIKSETFATANELKEINIPIIVADL